MLDYSIAAPKKLIEVALPLSVINDASVRESYIYRGNPSALHKWWAQRPMAAARAVLFAQLVNDPSESPRNFPTEASQHAERQRLFRLIEELVKWENTCDASVIAAARAEILESWRSTCAANAANAPTPDMFAGDQLPIFLDPFSGGGTLPLEAQRLGFRSYAYDLNPVAALITKVMIELLPRFKDVQSIRPAIRNALFTKELTGAGAIAADLSHYGSAVQRNASERLRDLFPKVLISSDIARGRPELKKMVGREAEVIAWLWARTVPTPNPAFRGVNVPLASTFVLSSKPGKEVYVEPVIGSREYEFLVKTGKPPERAKIGTRASGAPQSTFACLMSGVPLPFEYIRQQAKAGHMGARLMATVIKTEQGRFYLSPTPEMERIAKDACAPNVVDTDLPAKALGFRIQEYGMRKWSALYTQRQLCALTAISDEIRSCHASIVQDAIAAGMLDDGVAAPDGGQGARAYADLLVTLLAFAADKTAEYNCTIVPWFSKEDRPKGLFARQAIPMVWDYAEVNPFSSIGGSFSASIEIVSGSLSGCYADARAGHVSQSDAMELERGQTAVISTDPPYYDNIGYSDLSDFFYVWLRRTLRDVFPDSFATMVTPKEKELIATPFRHRNKGDAERFFLEGMMSAVKRMVSRAHPAYPITLYYAFRQSEIKSSGIASTGWETFLAALIGAGLSITGTWPIRTERGARSVAKNANALASSIVLVCRPRKSDALEVTRREFISLLRSDLPSAVRELQSGNVAPVDLAQAAIGPGMAIYTRFSRVLDADGHPLTVRAALALINEVLDEALAEQEGDFDAASRFAIAWFEQSGFEEGDTGVADVLARAKNTALNTLVRANVAIIQGNKIRLLKPSELKVDGGRSRTVWEITHHLLRALSEGGEGAAALLVASIGSDAEVARELAYRLYTIAERKKRALDALSYNALVQSWPEIVRLARKGHQDNDQTMMFGDQ